MGAASRRNPKVGGASSPLQGELGFIFFGFLPRNRVVLATFLLKCSAIVVSSSLLLSSMLCGGDVAAAVGGFFLGFRLRGARQQLEQRTDMAAAVAKAEEMAAATAQGDLGAAAEAEEMAATIAEAREMAATIYS